MGSTFMDTLIDWKEFEIFVKNLYNQEGNFIVERDVTEIGKSGAKRQIDVKLTLKTLFHKYVTIIECKKWKEKVNRQRIDILDATIRDLNASKGAMFTTSGYEVGAIEYAKSMNIDLYLVRDLTDKEWGLPGREIRLYFRMFGGNIGLIEMPKTKVGWLSNTVPPKKLPLPDITISQDQKFNDNLYLFSNKTNSKGRHLLDILFDTRRSVMGEIAKNYDFESLRKNEFKIGFDCNICLDFSKYEFCILNYPEYIMWIDKLRYNLPVSVNQYKFQHDRGNRFDFALIVEDYINSNPKVVSRVKEDTNIKIEGINEEVKEVKNPLQNDTGITIYTQPWVNSPIEKDVPIVKVDVDIIDLSIFYKIDSE